MTVHQIWQLIDDLAPFSSQLEWDNSGLLVGDPGAAVHGILFALDVTQPVIDEALRLGANLLVTHHPLMLDPRRSLTDGDREGRLLRRLIREDLHLIAAHTNLDQAPGGVNDALAERCGLTDVQGEGFVRVGVLPRPTTAGQLAADLEKALGDRVRCMAPENQPVSRLGLCSGAGSGEWEAALALGCDAFLSGEIKHHHALAMADRHVAALEAGHFATEVPGIRALADALQNRLNQLQYNLRIFQSRVSAYG